MRGDREFGGGERETAEGRWVWAARWSVVVVAVAVPAVVLATSPADGGRPAPVTVRPTAAAGEAVITAAVTTAGTAVLPPPHREVTPGVTPADPGTAAAVGVPYALDWNTRCETSHLRFAGRHWWTPKRPVLPPGLPGAQGPGSAPRVLPGWATLTAADRLRFDAPGYLAGPVLLEPAAEAGICE
ncbi:hypothetical protein GCM10009639_41920 [Kitasatospora putterlickiae]|uniref:Uncharacterized protein n=1 Tax=Kitasatospora putterlickiae TaxID=221725 RepID=A0ABN1Y886_9ACTN